MSRGLDPTAYAAPGSSTSSSISRSFDLAAYSAPGSSKASSISRGFDLTAYAARQGCRVRNLHDGYPVPPALPEAPRRSRGYAGLDDRQDAIVGVNGWVVHDLPGRAIPGCQKCPAEGRLGWYLLCDDNSPAAAARSLERLVRRLLKAGATVTQRGGAEAAGFAPLAAIDAVLEIIAPYWTQVCPENTAFSCGLARYQRAEPILRGSDDRSVPHGSEDGLFRDREPSPRARRRGSHRPQNAIPGPAARRPR